MKVIISKVLNKTDLAMSGSHGGLVVYKSDQKMLIEFFEQPKIKQTFIDKESGKEFLIRYADYTSNGKTPNDRITPIGRYATKYDLQPGDILVFEKNNLESRIKYYIDYAKRINSTFFAGKSTSSVEVLNIDQFKNIIENNIESGNIIQNLDGSYEMDVIFYGVQGTLLLVQKADKMEMFFNGEHIEENNMYYELDTEVIPFELKKMTTWNIEIYADCEDIKANELADEELVKSIITENFENLTDEYVPVPEAKAEKKNIGGRKVANRNRDTAAKALKRAGFCCEYNPDHETFLRKKIHVNYTEPHHLIPLQYEDEFISSLDVQANIVSLCSNCHNRIHYGADAKTLLIDLWNKRKDEIIKAGIGVMKNGIEININLLLSFYGLKF